MAVASPAILVAAATPIRFDFTQPRQKVRLQVRFFSTTEAQEGDEIADGLGDRDVTVKAFDSVSTPLEIIDAYANASLQSGYVNGTQTIAGGTWAEFKFVDFARSVSCACVVNTTPGGALTYRVIMSVVDAKVTVG